MYKLIQIDPSELEISKRAPFRFRFSLPGEKSHVSKGGNPDEVAFEQAGAEWSKGACKGVSRQGEDAEDRNLISSLKDMGIINPPIIIASEDLERLIERSFEGSGMMPGLEGGNRFSLICGFRRVSAARAIGMKNIDALLVVGCPDLSNIINLWLEEASSGKALSELEKVVLSKRLLSLSPRDLEGFIDYLSHLFARGVKRTYIEGLMAILEAEPDALLACHRGALRADELLRLKLHPAIDETAVACLLLKSTPNSRQRKEIIRLVELLAGKEPEKLGRFIDSTAPEEASAEEILKKLRRLTYPVLSTYEERIEDALRKLGLPTYARLSYPENLEGGAYTLRAKIRREEDLYQLLKTLGQAVSDGKIKRLLSLLRGEDGDR